MNFIEKIQQIEEILPDSRIRDKLLLSCAIYFKIRTNTPFRKIPLFGMPFSWYNLRYWLQKLAKTGDLYQIQVIVGGAEE